jgi:hypothetical protein
MQILPIDPSFQRVILQGNRSPEGLQLTLGQKIAATVLKINEEGQLLLGFGTQKVWARSDLLLAEGQQLQLRVNQNGPTVELQILDTTADSPVENYEMATLLQASAGRGGTATNPPDPTRLLEVLQQLVKSNSQLLTEPQSHQLRALLQPLSVGSDAKMLLPQIKNLIENSGVFFEAKLRAVLEALDASPEAALHKVASDLKLLLGELRQPLSSSNSPTPAGAASPPSLPVATTTALGQPAPGAAMILPQSETSLNLAVLSDQVLSRQTEAAFEWLKNGALQAELPMQFGTHSTQAKIRFFQETDKESKGHSGRPLNINIYLDLPDTGKLEAWARWEGQQIQATLYVRDAATRELFESQLQDLSANLREAGFSTAVLDVRVDPGRLYKIQESVEQTLPHEGSLLSLRV